MRSRPTTYLHGRQTTLRVTLIRAVDPWLAPEINLAWEPENIVMDGLILKGQQPHCREGRNKTGLEARWKRFMQC